MYVCMYVKKRERERERERERDRDPTPGSFALTKGSFSFGRAMALGSEFLSS